MLERFAGARTPERGLPLRAPVKMLITTARQRFLCEQFGNYIGWIHICQTLVAAVVKVGQLFVIDSQ